jgi:hypothetical protein
MNDYEVDTNILQEDELRYEKLRMTLTFAVTSVPSRESAVENFS